MTTTVYHNQLSPEVNSLLTDLFYLGSTMAVALQRRDASPKQRAILANEWCETLTKVQIALMPQLAYAPVKENKIADQMARYWGRMDSRTTKKS